MASQQKLRLNGLLARSRPPAQMDKLTGSMLALAQLKPGSGVPCNIKCQNRGRVSPDEYQQQAAAE